MQVRKIVTYTERLMSEVGQTAPQSVTRTAAAGVVANPFAGRFEIDLSSLFDLGKELGTLLSKEALALLPEPAVSYGKAAIVGVDGDVEHAHALLHPKLGKSMRDQIGGGAALIPSTAKLAAAGASLDVPLGHKDDAWSFDHFDALTIGVNDSPRPDEIMMVVAFADGGRVNARVGKERQII